MALRGYPDGQPVSVPNQNTGALGATSTVGNASTGALTNSSGVTYFGFNASLMKIIIDSGGPAYIQLNGNLATTADYRVTSGDTLTDWYDLGVSFGAISICATSTGLSGRFGAWG